jgi:ferrous iron transport protein A
LFVVQSAASTEPFLELPVFVRYIGRIFSSCFEFKCQSKVLNTFVRSSMISMDIKLSELKKGRSAIIKSIVKDELFLKLMEMGCLPGETITVDHIAPLGDPISVLISGYNLSLRINEADQILVEEII